MEAAMLTEERVLQVYSKNKAKVFDTDLFEKFVSRMTRLHVLSQFIDISHVVYKKEIELVSESKKNLKNHIVESTSKWDIPKDLSKMIITSHIRSLFIKEIEFRDVDEESKDFVTEKFFKDEFDYLW